MKRVEIDKETQRCRALVRSRSDGLHHLHHRKKKKLHLPQQIQQVVTGGGACLHPTAKTLEEVVLLRKYDPKKGQNPNQGFCEQMTDERNKWIAPNVAMRTRVNRPQTVPYKPDLKFAARPTITRKPTKKQSAIEALRDQLENVLNRLESLETKHMEHQIQNVTAVTSSDRQQIIDMYAEIEEDDPDQQDDEDMVLVMDGIQDTIHRLENALAKTEQEKILREEKYQKAAVTITSAARGFLQRNRYRYAMNSLGRWRQRNGSLALRDRANRYLRTRERLVSKMQDFVTIRDQKRVHATVKAWHEYCVSTRAERIRIQEGVKHLRESMENQLMAMCFFEWDRVTKSPYSKKAVQQSYKIRYEEMRTRLLAENEAKREPARREITREDVEEQMNQQAFDYITKRKSYHLMRVCFKAWSEDYMFSFNQLKNRADRYFEKFKFPKFLRRWKKYVELSHSEAKIAFSYSRAKFDTSHNEKVIENFARRTKLRKFFYGWKRLAEHCKAVRHRHKVLRLARMRAVFAAWKNRAQYQKQVKGLCIQEWRDLSTRRRKVPFRAWFIYAKTQIKQREYQNALLAGFERRKKRLLLSRLFRLWAHKAVYGKTGGMLTRSELIKALEMQKKASLAQEVETKQMKDTIAELEDSWEKEKLRSTDLQIDLAKMTEESMKLRCAQQQLEEEIVRLQSLFDSICLIHPGTAKKLLDIEEEKNPFKDRGVGSVARKAKATAQMTGGIGSGSSSGDGIATEQARPKACSKCGFDNSSELVQPKSARSIPKLWELEPPRIKEKQVSLGADNVVWVTNMDADIILRSKWAEKKLKQLARKNAKEENKTPEAVPNSEVEILHLQNILAFILSGDKNALQFFEDDTPTKDVLASALEQDKPEIYHSLRKAQIHTNASWNDFLQGLSKQFPLLHRVNDDPKQALARRIASAKQNNRQARLRPENRKVNVFQNK